MFCDVTKNWTEDYQRKADRIQLTQDDDLDAMLHVALENAIKYEGTNLTANFTGSAARCSRKMN